MSGTDDVSPIAPCRFDDQSLDPSCNDCEDLDSQSHSSFSGTFNKPIVVGYVFGPKKMSTMGVVLAEASRVKVIHEELEEDRYDEDEALFCDHEDPSFLTSAALKDLEEETTGRNRNGASTMSTIITLGNSNNTDLQHIVRYFQSSCSSAAASASIASMGETTVSTPTTTNSSSTFNNYKHRRSNGMGDGKRFPVQISFVPLDPDQPLEDQHGGRFDLILHKLTEDILTCSLMKGEKEFDLHQQGLLENSEIHMDPSWRRVRAVRDYCYVKNPNCCLVDDPKHVQTVMSRSEIANVLQQCLNGVKTSSGIPVRSPRFVVVPDCSTKAKKMDNALEHQNQTQELKEVLREQRIVGETKLSVPLIVKPLIAAGTKQSHCMLIALQESALSKLPPKSIMQEFVNHNATLFKVYVLGDFVNVYRRNSLPNLPTDLSKATVDLVEFDSQRPYPKLKDFGLCDEDKNDICHASCLEPIVTAEEVKPIVNTLKRAFGLELFGFDVLMGSENGECFVVDVNYFPSYKEVPNFPSLLARYLTQRAVAHRRKGKLCKSDSSNYVASNQEDMNTCTPHKMNGGLCGKSATLLDTSR